MTLTALPGRERSDALEGGVIAHYITRADDPALLRFYAAYDAAFILPDEKEDLEGLRACLSLNEGEAYERLSALYGPYREMAILLTEGANGPVLGAANFIAFAGDGSDPTISLSYIFVDANLRRRGLFITKVKHPARPAQDHSLHTAGNILNMRPAKHLPRLDHPLRLPLPQPLKW